MEDTIEIIVPTFINPNLFWIIDKKNLILRSAYHRVLKQFCKDIIQGDDDYYPDGILGAKIDNIWVRVKIDHILEIYNEEDDTVSSQTSCVCWLIDYGIMRIIKELFQIPKWLQKVPGFAQQASLLDIVTVHTEMFTTDDFDINLGYRKTLGYHEGVANLAMEALDKSLELYFAFSRKDDHNYYGDIIFLTAYGNPLSLTEYLIEKKCVTIDQDMFNEIDPCRKSLKKEYFQGGHLVKKLDRRSRINLKEIIFNDEENKDFPMEYFHRSTSYTNGIKE